MRALCLQVIQLATVSGRHGRCSSSCSHNTLHLLIRSVWDVMMMTVIFCCFHPASRGCLWEHTQVPRCLYYQVTFSAKQHRCRMRMLLRQQRPSPATRTDPGITWRVKVRGPNSSIIVNLSPYTWFYSISLSPTEYAEKYGTSPVWAGYRRNHKGGIPPQKTRKTCIVKFLFESTLQ